MKFIIAPNKTKTEPQYFKTGETTLRLISFESKIKGLRVRLEHAGTGLNKTVAINDTNISKTENISPFGLVWLEWDVSDKEYVIELVID